MSYRRQIELIRHEEWESGTIGLLKIDKVVFCFTLEPNDWLNRVNESSIPAQQYVCIPWLSPSFGQTFLVSNVPNRDKILFHAGNTKLDTAGCIILGSEVGKLKGDRAVLNSGNTFRAFLREMGDQPFGLTIREVY